MAEIILSSSISAWSSLPEPLPLHSRGEEGSLCLGEVWQVLLKCLDSLKASISACN